MSRKLALLVSLVSLVSLACVPPAVAASRHKHPVRRSHATVKVHASTDPETLALALAERYWGSTPCGGRITVTTSKTVPIDSEPRGTQSIAEGATALAWATFETPEGPTDFAAPPATYIDCTIIFNATRWTSWATDDFEFLEYCDVMTKEVGHFLGYPDEWENPKSIMYTDLGWENQESVPECLHITTWWGNENYNSGN